MTTALLIEPPVEAVRLTVKCPLEIPTASYWEGCYYIECGCDIEVTVEQGPTIVGGWHIATMPSGCPFNPYGDAYTAGERAELERRIAAAWERR